MKHQLAVAMCAAVLAIAGCGSPAGTQTTVSRSTSTSTGTSIDAPVMLDNGVGTLSAGVTYVFDAWLPRPRFRFENEGWELSSIGPQGNQVPILSDRFMQLAKPGTDEMPTLLVWLVLANDGEISPFDVETFQHPPQVTSQSATSLGGLDAEQFDLSVAAAPRTERPCDEQAAAWGDELFGDLGRGEYLDGPALHACAWNRVVDIDVAGADLHIVATEAEYAFRDPSHVIDSRYLEDTFDEFVDAFQLVP